MIKIKLNLLEKGKKEDILKWLNELFKKRAIKISSENDSIKSLKIPLILLSFDPRNYSRNNWIGINPFIYLSSFEIKLKQEDYNDIKIEMTVNRFRSIVFFLLTLALLVFIAVKIPITLLGVGILSTVSIIVFLYLFILCTNYLIKTEIRNTIRKAKT